MVITKEQQDELLQAAKPLIQWINENCNPHAIVLVTLSSATLIAELATVGTDEFIKD